MSSHPPTVYFRRASFSKLLRQDTLRYPPCPRIRFGWIDSTWIPTWLFQATMDARFPIVIIAAYAVATMFLNRHNQARQSQPWAISRTRGFRRFVYLHNIALTLYSLWACVSIWTLLWSSRVDRQDPLYTLRTVDRICGGHHFRTASGQSEVEGPWTAGVYVAWTFYLSKAYEMLDTMIILAKGKRATRLHVYHHLGVLLCGWASVRYVLQASFIGLLLNSTVHTLVYSYYTLSAFRIHISSPMKAGLTVIQIGQFGVGLLFSLAFVFIQYDVPLRMDRQPDQDSPSTSPRAANTTRGSPSGAGGDDLVPQYRTVTCLKNRGDILVFWGGFLYVCVLMLLFVGFFRQTYLQRHKTKTL
ncbi:elongation of very long chain fatty acids protein [Aspergillus candidus]|uniref:Elongation of fatty acids protein n=1 Tax=Aspergillus candidus TaxID=41067 RepID=A0A2I2FM89_ASPCN|nr:ELO family [Aspergillus candidus]PLB41745.1 ELO family [Aspergillus candidus]